ncbi:MAG: excinuclease ABC subunit UvrC [Candidatus Lokiarchaeota archaeon]|nr:excinuclease ABC subunit UvrC [Candidatus Lokiarchaeota archaeon]
MSNLDLERKSLPNEPGIYFFLNKKSNIIYIGKAINLRKRVNQYFLKQNYADPFYEEKIKELVKNTQSIEIIVTENEKEAKILENIQIKKHQPRFNVVMRDSKTYPWVGFFYSEKYPRIRIIRGPEKYSQENLFLGPYTDKKEITRILRDLRKIFPYCSCKKKVKRSKRPCLYYQLKLCPGPCIEAIPVDLYMQNVKQIELFLKGQTEELKGQIQEKMDNAAEEQNYEIAAFWRDKLQAIDHSVITQNVLLERKENKDIISYYNDEKMKFTAMVIIHIREGKIMNKSSFSFNIEDKLVHKNDIFPSIMEQFYQNLTHKLPEVIVVPEIYEGVELFREILKEYNNDLQIRTPLEDEYGLLRIAHKNAKVIVEQEIQMEDIKKKEGDLIQKALEEAKEILNLPKVPRIIEGFDISNIEGTDATGSMVYFLEGRPYNKNYRHFNIRTKSTPDDVAMMKEVIKRRYTMILENNFMLPDLILVDGGKGQLNAGYSVLKDLGIEGIPIIGLAKKFEEIFVPNKREPIILPRNSDLLKIFQRVRDEAHRFAVKLHKKQREKRVQRSVLDDIKGIGPATRNNLLKHFGSVENIKKAAPETIAKVVGKRLADTILKELGN